MLLSFFNYSNYFTYLNCVDIITTLEYNWKKNKGYPTKEYRQAIKDYGTTPFHRMTFRLLDEQLSLEF